MEIIPEWMANLDDEDVTFIKNFLLVSGSLKEAAAMYGVTYPTVRLRLGLGVFFLVRHFRRRGAKKRQQAEQDREMDRMKIDDL